MTLARIYRNAGGSAADPAWAVSQAVNTMIALAAGSARTDLPIAQRGSRIRDISEDGSPGDVTIRRPWTGACGDKVRRRVTTLGPGGHSDRDYNSVLACLLNQATPSWAVLRATTADRSGGHNTENSACDYGDGRPRASHSARRNVCLGGRAFIAGVDNFSSSLGLNSSAVFGFNYDTGDYTAYGRAFDDTQWPDAAAFHGGVSLGDPTTGYIWIFTQATDLDTKYACAVFDTNTNAFIRHYKSYMPFGYQSGAILHDKSPKILVIEEGSSGLGSNLRGLDISSLPADGSTLTWTTLSTTGSPSRLPNAAAARPGCVYSPKKGKLYHWLNDGANLITLTPPSPISNWNAANWTWATFTPDSATETPANLDVDTQGVQGWLAIVEGFPTGFDSIFLCNEVTQPTYAWKV